MRVDAPDKRGVGLSAHGTVYPLNPECAAYFELGLDNDLKFNHNRKTYPQLIYEAVGMVYAGQRYRLYPSAADAAQAARRWASLGIEAGEVVVGLNTGAGRIFANKNWPGEKFAALARRLVGQNGWRVALLGGPDERERNARIAEACPGVVDLGGPHSELEFAALVRRCDVLVTGDTMAMHVAIACDVPAVVLFGPTCQQEIDVYGRGEKIVTGLSCAPCYLRACDRAPNCMDDISVERVLHAVQRWVSAGAAATAPPATVGAQAAGHVPAVPHVEAVSIHELHAAGGL
jgi:heptosyltransferase-2